MYEIKAVEWVECRTSRLEPTGVPQSKGGRPMDRTSTLLCRLLPITRIISQVGGA